MTDLIIVDPTQRAQQWLGVGAALTDASTELLTGNPIARQMLYSATASNGAQLNLVRLPLSATDFSRTGWTWSWNAANQQATPTTQAQAAITMTKQLSTVRADLGVVAAAWTAPSAMKSPSSLNGGELRGARVAEYGDMLVAQVANLVGQGVPLLAISLGNEPGHPRVGETTDYPTMRMSDAQLIALGTSVGPRIAAHGVGLWAVDHNWNDRGRVDTVLAGAPGDFSAAAFHCYAGNPAEMAGLPVPAVVTECTGTNDTWAGTFAWDMANLIDASIAAGSTGLMMWNLALDPSNGPRLGGCATCRGLVTIDPATKSVTPGPEFYALGQLARAARPGAVVIGSSSSAGIPSVAFANPDGTIGVMGHNNTGATRTVSVRFGAGDERQFEVRAGELFTVVGRPLTP